MSERNGSTSRYSIYFSPAPEARLHELGSRWLGRDAVSGKFLDPGLPPHLSREHWLEVTESPRRYGFHATLKPPFRLAEGARLEDLQAALRDFATAHNGFEAPALAIGILGNFLALTLVEPSGQFARLAAECVAQFDRFRASSTAEELDRRLSNGLSAREREHVLRWGYPYVFDTWKFHMSLTASLPAQALQPLEQHLRERFASINPQPLAVDSVCIFHESQPGAPFREIDRVSLRSR